MGNEVVRFALSISPGLAEKIEEMATSQHTTKSDIIRKSIALMSIAIENKALGNSIIVVDKNDKKVAGILGL